MLYIENRIRKSVGLSVRKGLNEDISGMIADIIIDLFEKSAIPLGVLRDEISKDILEGVIRSDEFNKVREICVNIVSEVRSGGRATEIADAIGIMIGESDSPKKTILEDGNIEYEWSYPDRGLVADLMEGAEIISMDRVPDSLYKFTKIRFIPKGINATLTALFEDRYDESEYREKDFSRWAHFNGSNNSCRKLNAIIDPRSFSKSVRRNRVRKVSGFDWNAHNLTGALEEYLISHEGCPGEVVEQHHAELDSACRSLMNKLDPKFEAYVDEVARSKEDSRIIALVEKMCDAEFDSTNAKSDETTHEFYAETETIETRAWNGCTRVGVFDRQDDEEVDFMLFFKLPGMDYELEVCMSVSGENPDEIENELRNAFNNGDFPGAKTIWEKYDGCHRPYFWLIVPRYNDSW